MTLDAGGAMLLQYVKAGKAARASFLKTGDKINKFAYEEDYAWLYAELDPELSFHAKVSKASQFVEVIGPYVYQYNPVYNVTPKKWSEPEAKLRAPWEEQYLDRAADLGDQHTECRRAVSNGLIFGRGLLYTGYNQRTATVQHVFDDVHNFIDDPDARTKQDRNLGMRIRLTPRWELKNKYPQAAGQIEEITKASDLPSHVKSVAGSREMELIRTYDIYMKVGLGRYTNGVAGETAPGGQVISDDPAKYVLTEDGEILAGDPWEIPFWKLGLWPWEELDMRERPGHVYPAAPISPGLGQLIALNWIHSLYIAKMRESTRTPWVFIQKPGIEITKDQLAKAMRGEQLDLIVIKATAGNEDLKLSDVFQQLTYADPVAQLERFNSLIGAEFDKSTGLYDILYSGSTPTQLRTAEDAKLKDRNSRSRIDDMRTQTEKWTTRLGIKARIAARYLETSEDIGKIFGKEAAQAWGDLASPQEVAQQRQVRDQIAMQGEQMRQQIASYAQQGADPTQLAQLASKIPKPPPVTGVDFDDWIKEADVTIESGSMRRLDHDQKIDAADAFMNQPFAAMMTAGLVAPALEGLRAWADIKDLPERFVTAIDKAIEMASHPPAPPAPPQTQPAATPQAKGA